MTIWPWNQYQQIITRLNAIDTRLGKIMTEQDELNATAAAEETDLSAIAASNAAIQTAVQALVTAQAAGQPLDLTQIKQAAADLHTQTTALTGTADTAAADAGTPPPA